ncbi:trypsin-4-like [Aphidius gifuensis]|uniref:trypsin-4-like n=1 Tax=Aphidius gifuensis TaxID=684658 RepID=UPI001CDBF170|nr:trypsin-4-like [Aphidius gifuensis]
MLVDGNSAKKIYGGQTVGIHKHPYQVSIQYKNHHICGGVIISYEHILTAESCISAKKNVFYGNLQVLVGSNDLLIGESPYHFEIHQVANIICHEEYNPLKNWINDIAILKVESPIVLVDALIQTASIPVRGRISSKYFITGWGINPVTNIMTRYLQRLDVKVITPKSCRDKYHNNVFSTQYCLLPVLPNTGVTLGNGGSPVMSSRTVIGIISIASIDIHKPVIHTRVYEYADWIKQMIRKI